MTLLLASLLVIAGGATPVEAATGDISTVVGTGSSTPAGLCEPGTSASIWNPAGVAIDARGNIYTADFSNSRVRRIDPFGFVTTVAGITGPGYSGDGIPAYLSQLDGPTDVAIDPQGNLFIADRNNARVRRVDATTGIITTVAGTGTEGFSGDGGPATAADLDFPQSVSTDAQGNLFISDRGNHRIRRVDATTGIITTVVGVGTSGFSGDGGAATAAQINNPFDAIVDGAGNLFIADSNNARVRAVSAADGTISTLTGDGSIANLWPNSLSLSGETLYISDAGNHRIRTLTGGVLETVAGIGTPGFSGDGGPATSAALNSPAGVQVDAHQRLVIIDGNNDRIRRVTDGTITTVAGQGTHFAGDCPWASTASVGQPYGMAVADDGFVYVASGNSNRVLRFDPTGDYVAPIAGSGAPSFTGDGGPAPSATLDTPFDVALGPDGHLYIADSLNYRIRRVDLGTGTISTVAGTGSSSYSGDGGPALSAGLGLITGMTFDPSGNLFLSSSSTDRVRRIDAQTGIITKVAGTGAQSFSGDGGPATAAALHDPYKLATDDAGNLFIADRFNDRIRRVDAATGIITTVAGTGGTGSTGDGGPATSAEVGVPLGVGVDDAGNIFIGQTASRVRRVDAATGVITTVAGTGTEGFSGDGGPATSAQLRAPVTVQPISSGDLYIADNLDYRIRMVEGQEATGYLRVTTSPAVPASILVDGVARDSWGLTWVEFPTGSHEVCFGPMPGFTPPPCEVVDVLPGQTAAVQGTYAARGYLRVLTSPALPSTISVDGVPRNDWGVWTEVDPGSYEVCFGAVAGYDVPACRDVVVSAGATATTTGTFSPNGAAPGPGGSFGYLRATTDPAVGTRITVDGEWRDSWGLTWLKLPTGNHEICFDEVLYATRPTCQNVSITAGNTTVATGSFVVHGFLRVLTDPAVPATIFVDGTRANAWGVWTSVEPGSHAVCFGATPGLYSPPCQVVAVGAGALTTVTGNHVDP